LPVVGKDGKDGKITWAQQNLIAFGELSLRTCVSYYSTVANYPEVINELVFVDIIKVSINFCVFFNLCNLFIVHC
jgi:hypothetical protein